MKVKIKKLSNFSEMLFGLAFKKNLEPVYFETRWGIHTFFVRKPIDVVICDDNNVVRKIKKNLKPWRIFIWNPKFKNVYEFPANSKYISKISIGSKICIPTIQ